MLYWALVFLIVALVAAARRTIKASGKWVPEAKTPQAARSVYRRAIWIPPRFSSSSSLCCFFSVAAGKAGDVGTKFCPRLRGCETLKQEM